MNNMGQINGGWDERHRDLQTTVSSSYRCRAQSVSWPGPTAALITSMCASPFGSVSGLLVIFGLFSAPQHIFHLSHTADVVQNSPCMFSIQFVVSFSCFLLVFFFSVTARVWPFSSSSSPVAVRHTVSVAMEPALCSHGNGPGTTSSVQWKLPGNIKTHRWLCAHGWFLLQDKFIYRAETREH